MKTRFFTTSRGKATWFYRGTAALLVPALFIIAPVCQAHADTTNATTTPKLPRPQQVTVNRTLPKFQAPDFTVTFSASPTDAEIFAKPLFSEPLLPIGGKTTPEENQALAAALLSFHNRNARDDFSSLEGFLNSHLHSPWQISLLVNLGALYRQTGWYGKAMETWQSAWILGQAVNAVDFRGKAIIDRALVELLVMNARVGRMDELSSLIKAAETRQLVGSSRERVDAAKQALVLMQTQPETSFRCGPMAVEKIRNLTDGNDPKKWKVLSDVSTQKGTSLAQLGKLSTKLSLDMVPAYRSPGSAILVPSVVNWKIGHFAAIVGTENGLIHLSDPTFNKDVWISSKALDEEASGYFLVKRQPMPTGWKLIDAEQAAGVWGKGQVSGSDDTCNSDKDAKTCHASPLDEWLNPGSPCSSSYYQGLWPDTLPFLPSFTPSDGSPVSLPIASVHMMLASLCVEDNPLAYKPPYGPPVDFHITYSQREAYQPSVFTYSNLGPQWTFSWLTYITDEPNFPGIGATQYLSDGGTLSYGGYVSATKSYAPEPHTGAVLKITGSSSYELDLPDGSKQIFSAATNTTPRKIFMTQSIDPQGNGLTFTYDGQYRMVAVTDSIHQVTSLSYTSPVSSYLITKVTDPFNRSTSFLYNSAGVLQSCTNVNNVISTFAYQGGNLQSFTTPYGTTRFDVGQDNVKRWVQLTDPQGGQERLETFNYSGSLVPVPAAKDVPAGVDNLYLQYRNTFYWDKKAMMDAPGNYNQAQLVHWLENIGSTATMTGQIESYKAPLENRVYYLYPGQPQNYTLGTTAQPTRTLRVLDNGTTQVTQEFDAAGNALGKPTQSTSPPVTGNPAGRITNSTYDPNNNVDLTKITQQNQSGLDTLFSASYNSQHEPLTTTDAAGQTTGYTYYPNGQIWTLTAPNGEEKSFSYDGNGYLLNIKDVGTNTTLSSYTYDGFGRVATATDVNGYTVTYGYDNLDRVTSITYPDGTFDQNIYATLDLSLHKDRLNRWTQYFYNSNSQLTGVEDPQGRVTNYERCACGELLSMTDPKGQRTSWKNDIEGRLLTKTFPDATTYNYAYELTTSRLLTFTDAKSQVSTYTYNLDDSINQIAYTASAVATPTVSYSYDPYYLRLTQIQVGTAQTNYTYYPAGGLGAGSIWTDTSPIPNSGITYSYDQLGRVTTTSINGSTSTLTFDPLDRPSHETDSALSSTPFIYGYVGNTPRLQSVSYPNGQSTSYSYQPGPNQDFRLTDLTNFKTGTTVLSKFDYTYNANGTIASWQQQVESNNPTTWKYQYDGADQLLSAIETNSSQVQLAQYVYGYDLAGNRKSQQIGLAVKSTTINNPMNKIDSVGGGGPLQFTGNLSEPAQVTVGGSPALVNAANNTFSGTANVTAGITNNVSVVANDYNGNFSTNNYHVFVPSSPAFTMGYDANGNLNTNGQGQTYEWDAKDQLTAINYTGGAVVNGITRTEFTYDGLSRRVAIVEKQGTTVSSTKQFVWVGNRMAEERDGSGNVTKRFFGLGEQIGATVYYLSRDQLGSIREVTNSSGVVQAQARYDYDPYGAAPLGSTSNLISGTNLSDFQYAGMYQHATSLLNLTKYRAYDPNTGRWLSRDPIAERGGINLYDYVLNNPVKHTDKLGLVIGVDDAAEAALVIEGATIFWNAEGPEIEEDLAPLSEEAEIELNQLEEFAKQLYPKLANTCQMHHPLPQYLGGPAEQDLVPLDGAYHQLITNAFRQQIPYGSTFTPAQVQAAWNQVYSQYPITR